MGAAITASGRLAPAAGEGVSVGELISSASEAGPWALLGIISSVMAGDQDSSRISAPVYRVWGGAAGPWGRSWTPVDPRTDPQNFRERAGLPDVNTGEYLTVGTLYIKTDVVVRPALPMPPGTGGTQGGWTEFVVPSPQTQIVITQPFVPLPPPINNTGNVH